MLSVTAIKKKLEITVQALCKTSEGLPGSKCIIVGLNGVLLLSQRRSPVEGGGTCFLFFLSFFSVPEEKSGEALGEAQTHSGQARSELDSSRNSQ